VKRLDRHLLLALVGPLPGTVAGISGLGLLFLVRRVADRPGTAGSSPLEILALATDAGLGALGAAWPIACGFAAALGVARLRDEGDLDALAAAGVGPRRMAAGLAVVAALAAAAAVPLAHHVGPRALARAADRLEAGALDALRARQARGDGDVLGAGPNGVVVSTAPGAAAWLRPGRGVVRARRITADGRGRVRAETVEAVLFGPQPDSPTRHLRVRSVAFAGDARPAVAPVWGDRPGRAWPTARLDRAAASPNTAPEAACRFARLAATRRAAPWAVLAWWAWAVVAVGRGGISPPGMAAVGVGVGLGFERLGAALGSPDLAATGGPTALAALALGGLLLPGGAGFATGRRGRHRPGCPP